MLRKKVIITCSLIVLVIALVFYIEDKFNWKKHEERAMQKGFLSYLNYRTAHPKYLNKKLYERDSLLIRFTVHALIENDLDFYGKYYETKDETSVYIGDIFYSSDSLKLFAFCTIQALPNEFAKEKYPQLQFYYDGSTIAGIRKTKKDIWKLYPTAQVTFTYDASIENSLNKLRWIYFTDKIQTYSVDIFNLNLPYKIKDYHDPSIGYGASYKYNLTQPEFWTDIVFIKDNRIQGLYDFQTEMKYSQPLTFIERDFNMIVVPDSIKALYK